MLQRVADADEAYRSTLIAPWLFHCSRADSIVVIAGSRPCFHKPTEQVQAGRSRPRNSCLGWQGAPHKSSTDRPQRSPSSPCGPPQTTPPLPGPAREASQATLLLQPKVANEADDSPSSAGKVRQTTRSPPWTAASWPSHPPAPPFVLQRGHSSKSGLTTNSPP